MTALLLAMALATYSAPSLVLAAPPLGAITGVALAAGGAPLANHSVRVRSLQTGDVVASVRTSAAGAFDFSSLVPGSYVVEVVDDVTGRVVSISGATVVGAGETSMAAMTALASVVGGAIGTPLLLLLLAGGTAGAVSIWAATKDEASPSR